MNTVEKDYSFETENRVYVSGTPFVIQIDDDKDNIKMTLEICESNICSSGNDYFEVKHRLMGLFDQFYDDNISTIGGNVENGKIEVRLKNKY